MDKHLNVTVISKSDRPNFNSYIGMHQCYAENPIQEKLEKISKLSEEELGRRIVNNCLKYGHFSVCYDKDTEVLTKDGFKLWEDVTKETELYAVDPKTGVGHYEKPIDLINLPYKGDMVYFNHKRVNLLVTPDHKMYVKTRINCKGVYGDLFPIKAADIYGRQFKVSAKTNLRLDDRIPVDFTNEELSIIGFWLGSGNVCKNKNHISFHLKEQRKINFLSQLNCYLKRENYWYYDNNKLSEFLHTYCLDSSGNKILPDCLLNIPYEQFLYLSDGLAQSNGFRRKSRLQYDYSTSHKPLAEKLYLLYTLNGLAVKLKTNPIWRDPHKLIIHPNTEFRLKKNQQSIQSYEGNVYCAKVSTGALIVRRNGVSIISGNCEHNSITFLVSGFVHNVIGQITRHRNLSFSVQSQRYTGERIVKTAQKLYKLGLLTETEETIFNLKKEEIEKVLYYRPEGYYLDREGHKYSYTKDLRDKDILRGERAIKEYFHNLVNLKMAPEHARDYLPQNIRQNFVVTMNARSLLHFLDLRLPKNAQLEIRELAELFYKEFKLWMPAVAEWYDKSRAGKNKLAP